jgi:tRNA(fMet)-specific endonuclease VapC
VALLDTTVYVDLRGRGGNTRRREAEAIMQQLLRDGQTLFTGRINVAEIYVGVELSRDRDKELAALREYLTRVEVLELEDAAARQFGRVRAELQRRGKLVGDMDILIAAIALANGHAVVTRNKAHYADVPGLSIISYGN